MIKDFILPTIIAIIGGAVPIYLSRKRAKLVYEIVKSNSFPAAEGKLRYFIIRIKNKGNLEVENIKLDVKFEGSNILLSSISDENLLKGVLRDSGNYSGEIITLNPKESVDLTLTVPAETDLPAVSLRGKGITGAKDEESDSSPNTLLAYVSTLFAIGVLTYSIGRIFYNATDTKIETQNIEWRKEIEQTRNEHDKKMKAMIEENEKFAQETNDGKPETVQIVFSVLNRNGLNHVFVKLLENSGDFSYWRTGFTLFYRFLNYPAERSQIKTALDDLLKNPIAPSSYGLLVYLRSKIETHEGNSIRAEEFLKLCKDKTPLMYSHLLDQDAMFDTRKLAKKR